MRAEFQQNGVGRKILIVIALADKDILDQSRVFLVRNGLDLLGKGAVDLAVLIAAAYKQTYLGGVFTVNLRDILVRIGDAVAMDIDDRIRSFLQQTLGSAPAAR